MKVKFWGVRGSIPTPVSSEAIQRKISTVIQRARPEDLLDANSRELFLSRLPSWIFGTTGGNTPCLEVRLDSGQIIIIDAGSGLRELGKTVNPARPDEAVYQIFFSHFHWDHLQGLPFFDPLFNPKASIYFRSPEDGLEEILRGQMRSPYFPVPLEGTRAKLSFIKLRGETLTFGKGQVSYKRMNHPGGCYAYKITENKRSFIYATDSELIAKDFERTEENIVFFQNADAIALDSQYTLGEAVDKYNWGHSSFSLAVDFAAEWEIRTLYLFHHEPMYDDKKLSTNLQSARWYATHLGKKAPEIYLAEEGALHVI
jgi:phosphoribosyl 1,2-cyclic phosphodiesterase